jgi:RNA polymerase sigma factor (sigma-70 family)
MKNSFLQTIAEPGQSLAEATKNCQAWFTAMAFRFGLGHRAADLFQDFVLHMESRAHVIPDDNPRAFCRTCAKNLLLEALRRDKRHPEQPLDFEPAPASGSRRPENTQINKLYVEQLLALAGPQDGALLRGKYIEGLSYEELSAIFGASVEALTQRVRRALLRLRTLEAN